MQLNFQSLGSFWSIVRELDPRDISSESSRPFRLLICGAPDAGKTTLAGALAGGEWSVVGATPQVRIVEGLPPDPPEADLCLYVVDGAGAALMEELQVAAGLARRGVHLVYVVTKIDLVRVPDLLRRSAEQAVGVLGPSGIAFVDATDREDVAKRLVPLVLAALPDRRLALGRWLPPFREQSADQVIREAARVNAEFAFLSSLPASIPFLNIGADGADLLVLTKNQLMMVFRLATLYGRALDSRTQLLVEIAPVVGASFLWRTAARSLVGLLPGFAAAAPKVLIAFAGTYVVGQAAHYYYRIGRRPSAELLDRYSREALDLAQKALPHVALPSLPNLPALPSPFAPRRQPDAS